MKLKEITIGQDVAARVKRYTHSASTTERCRVEDIDGRYIALWVHKWQECHQVYFTVIDATWSDHEAALAADKAKNDARLARQRAAWDARRAEERERFEQFILPAFRGLPAPDDRNADLAEYVEEMMLDGGSSTVTLREDSLAAIAARITELSNIVAQSALTAQDLPQAGWGVTPEQVEDAREEAAQTGRPERVIIEIPFADLGLGDN